MSTNMVSAESEFPGAKWAKCIIARGEAIKATAEAAEREKNEPPVIKNSDRH